MFFSSQMSFSTLSIYSLIFICVSLWFADKVSSSRPSPPFGSTEYFGCSNTCIGFCPTGICTDPTCSNACYNVRDHLTWCYTPNYASATCGLVCQTGYSVGPGPNLGYPTCLCAPGWGNDGSTSDQCSICGSGTYKTDTGFGGCTSCPSNSYSSGATGQQYANGACNCNAGYYGLSSTSDSNCNACPSNSYSSGASGQQYANGACNCNAGYYGLSSTSDSSCNACPSNSQSTGSPNQQYANGACKCNAGYYGLSSSSDTNCYSCPAGSFKTSSGNGDSSSCSSCPAGFTASGLTGQNTMIAACLCPAGYGFDPFFMSCYACPANYYKAAAGNVACTLVPPGYLSNGTAIYNCSAGYFHNSTFSNQTCVPLPPSTVSDGNNGLTCPQGTYLDSSINYCFSCNLGTYKPGLGEQCTVCPDGFSTNTTGAVSKSSCQPGPGLYFNTTTNSTQPCPVNTYKDVASFDNCSACPFGLITNGEGQNSSAACGCRAGFYWNENTCLSCPAEFYKEFGNSSECHACPWGTTTRGAIASTSKDACTPKTYVQLEPDSTYQCIAGYEPTETDCVPCNVGFYKSAPGNVPCQSCAEATGEGYTYCVSDSSNLTSSNSIVSSSSKSGNTTVAIAASAAAGFVALVLGVGVVVLAARRKAKQDVINEEQKKKAADAFMQHRKGNLSLYDLRRLNLSSTQSVPTELAQSRRNESASSASFATFNLISGTATKFPQVAIAYPAFLEIDCEVGIRKICEISRGGFGAVYKAEVVDVELKNNLERNHESIQVALKVAHEADPAQSDSAAEDEFMNEAAIMYASQFCPFVVRIIAVSRGPERSLAMRLYNGSLFDLIHATPDDSTYKEAIETTSGSYLQLMALFAYQLNCALTDLHSVNIVHLDIKPANVLFERVAATKQRKLSFQIALSDFGMSRATNSELVVQSHEKSFVNGLSLSYSAPESFAIVRLMNNNKGSTSNPQSLEKLDVFSYGSTVYEMISKQVPLKGVPKEQIEQHLISGKRSSWDLVVDYPRTLFDEELFKQLQEQVELCWTGHPSKRPSSLTLNDKLKEIEERVLENLSL